MEERYHVKVDENYEFPLTANDLKQIDQAELSEQKVHLRIRFFLPTAYKFSEVEYRTVSWIASL